jgi:hypothetical protein
MARRVGNHYGGITPLDGRNDALRSKDADHPKQQDDPINVKNEVPFLITASELQDRKNKRRRKRNAPRP